MSSKAISHIGEVYGMLVITSESRPVYTPSGKRLMEVDVQCSCGNVLAVKYRNLRDNKTKHCGCVNNIIGKKYGKLTIVGDRESVLKPNGKFRTYCAVQCECAGNVKSVPLSHLISGKTKSCGCLVKEISRKINLKHGKNKSPEHKAWSQLRQNCYNKACVKYRSIGALGIVVCDKWKDSFENFLKDMGQRPSSRHRLVRVNKLENYDKENCRWEILKTVAELSLDPAYVEKRLRQKRETAARQQIKDPDRCREKGRNSYKRCAAARKAGVQAWKKLNRERINAQAAANRKRDPEATRLKDKANREKECNKRLRSTPQYIISRRLRTRLRQTVVKYGTTKAANTTLELTGCDSETLLKHLESQFVDGMTWENMKEWHVDHILPIAAFDITNPAHQKLCFHFTNLQPLWGRDNQKKHAKMTEEQKLKLERLLNSIDTEQILCNTPQDSALTQQ